MAVYLARSGPRCRNFFGVVIAAPQGRGNSKPIKGRCATCGHTKSTGRPYQAMAQQTIDKIPPGPKLDAPTAEKVFGWKNVHKHEGSLVGKKQDKVDRWRLAS